MSLNPDAIEAGLGVLPRRVRGLSVPIEDQIAAVQSAIWMTEHAMLSYAPNSELHLEQIKKRDALRSVLDTLAANNREVERRREAEAALERVSRALNELIRDSNDPGVEALCAAYEAGQVLNRG